MKKVTCPVAIMKDGSEIPFKTQEEFDAIDLDQILTIKQVLTDPEKIEELRKGVKNED